MFKMIQKLIPAPPIGLYSPVAPFKDKRNIKVKVVLLIECIKHLTMCTYTQQTDIFTESKEPL